jgi:hypothetical protein
MKGVSLPAVTDFDWNDPRTETPYFPEGPRDEIAESRPKVDEQLAHSREIPRMGKKAPLRILCVWFKNARPICSPIGSISFKYSSNFCLPFY